MLRLFTIFMLATLLVGCGFTPRGQTPVPPALHVMYLQSDDPYGNLTKQLRHTLKTRGITLTQAPEEAPFTLAILSDGQTQQVSAVSGSTQVVQYTLTYHANYQIRHRKGQIIIPTTTVTSTRNYSANINQMLGSSDEQRLLTQDMQRDVISQILYHLSATNTLRAL